MMAQIYSRSKPNTGVMTRHEDREFSPVTQTKETKARLSNGKLIQPKGEKQEVKPWISPYDIQREEVFNDHQGTIIHRVEVFRKQKEEDYRWEGYHVWQGKKVTFLEYADELQNFCQEHKIVFQISEREKPIFMQGLSL